MTSEMLYNSDLLIKTEIRNGIKTITSIVLQELGGDSGIGLEIGSFVRLSQDLQTPSVPKGTDLKVARLVDPSRHNYFVLVEVPEHESFAALSLEMFEEIAPEQPASSFLRTGAETEAMNAAV